MGQRHELLIGGANPDFVQVGHVSYHAVDDGMCVVDALGRKLLHVLIYFRWQSAKVGRMKAEQTKISDGCLPDVRQVGKLFETRTINLVWAHDGKSADSERQVSNRLSRRAHLDFDVVAQAV